MELPELIARVEDAGITVSWARLKTCNAGWDHETRTIWLDHSLHSEPRNALSILSHEFGHALLGHVGPQSAREEARADTVAAGILINPAEYALAEAIYPGDAHAIAFELGVTARIVTAYQDGLPV